MSKLLYIKASPRGKRSKSIMVAEEFIDAYREVHVDDEVEELDLFEADLPGFDGFVIEAKYNIMHGREHSPEQEQAWGKVEEVIGHFKSADKYVFAVPMWNFGIPYRLKQYIDILVQPGLTFSVSEAGYEGLIKGKPVMVIYARGGSYSAEQGNETYDMQKRYLELILGFIGFEQIGSIVVQPTMQGSAEQFHAMFELAKYKARQSAEDF